MYSKKIYKSPLVDFTALEATSILIASGDDFGDWTGTNWGTTGGEA